MSTSFSKTLMFSAVAAFSTLSLLPQQAQAHCEVPCGIYDDHARVDAMTEHCATIIKASKKMAELSGKTDAQSMNQMVRWVNNKEIHAQKIIDIISNYYLTQRVKSSQSDYAERLKIHHAVIVAAMKAKQNADGKFGKELNNAIKNLAPYYPEPKKAHDHGHGHK